MALALAFILIVVGGIVAWSRRTIAIRIGIAVLIVTTLAVAAVHGARPAVLPLYAGALVVVVYAAQRRRIGRWPRLIGIPLRVILTALCAGCVLVTAVTWVSPPPQPSGRYGVGAFDWVVTDRARPEVYTQDPDDTREILVRVWYPSEAPPADQAQRRQWMEAFGAYKGAYVAPEVADAFAASMLPDPAGAMVAAELRRLSSPAQQGVPIAPGAERFPVLLFSPGYGMPIDLSAAQLAEIASHGYVVLGVNATYETSVTVLPDGRVLRRREMLRQDEQGRSFAQEQRLGAEAQESFPKMLGLMDLPEPQRRAEYLQLRQQRMQGEQFLVSAIEQRVLDLQQVLTALAAVANGSARNLLSDRIDLGRVGVFGMSLGGPTAGQFCLLDERCKAGLNYDGEIWGLQLSSLDARVPFMWIRGRPDSQQAAAYSLGIPYVFESSSAPAYLAEIDDMDHMHFTDLAFLSPFVNWLGLPARKQLGQPGYVLQARQAALDLTVAFFDRYLKDAQAPALSGKLHSSAVTIKSRNAGRDD